MCNGCGELGSCEHVMLSEWCTISVHTFEKMEIKKKTHQWFCYFIYCKECIILFTGRNVQGKMLKRTHIVLHITSARKLAITQTVISSWHQINRITASGLAVPSNQKKKENLPLSKLVLIKHPQILQY